MPTGMPEGYKPDPKAAAGSGNAATETPLGSFSIAILIVGTVVCFTVIAVALGIWRMF